MQQSATGARVRVQMKHGADEFRRRRFHARRRRSPIDALIFAADVKRGADGRCDVIC